MVFNKLTLIERIPYKGKEARYKCLCECGKEKEAFLKYLVSEKTKSCGCDYIYPSKTHGQAKTKLFRRWASIKDRCYNKNGKDYKNYGGRGITMCDEWFDFANFKKWFDANCKDESLTIDRVNTNKGYFPDNCRFATTIEQNRNKRTTVLNEVAVKAIRFCHYEMGKTIKQIAVAYKINHNTAYRAIVGTKWKEI